MKLRQVIEQYITLKQSLGFRFHTETRILKGFGKAMGKASLGQVSPVAVRTYLDSPDSAEKPFVNKIAKSLTFQNRV